MRCVVFVRERGVARVAGIVGDGVFEHGGAEAVLKGVVVEGEHGVAGGGGGLQVVLQLFVRQVAVAENLGEQAGADRFADVDGDGGHAAVGVTQAVVAALRADDVEAGTAEGVDQLLAGDATPSRRQATRTCWTAMNSRRAAGLGSSRRHRTMASRMRSVSLSRDFAWVWQPGRAGTVAT